MIYLVYGPRFLDLFVSSIAFSTSRLAEAMAADDMLVDSDPFGSGSPSRGLK